MTLIQSDLSQVEVIGAAQYSKDKTLIELLNNGVSLHKWTASNILEKDILEITPKEKDDAKAGNFGILYGNGARKLSQTTGRSEEWAQNYIERFYELFPGVRVWHEKIQKEVDDTGQLRLFTGMILRFKKYLYIDNKRVLYKPTEHYNLKAKARYWSPEVKNYPVQHLGHLWNSILVGQFYRKKALFKRDKYLLINTVHDSLMIDCKPEHVKECEEDIQEIVDSIPEIMLKSWGEKLVVPLKVEISTGNSWYDL